MYASRSCRVRREGRAKLKVVQVYIGDRARIVAPGVASGFLAVFVLAGAFAGQAPPVKRAIESDERTPSADKKHPDKLSAAERQTKPAAPADLRPAGSQGENSEPSTTDAETGFHWRRAVKQSLAWLALQHGYAMSQGKTRRALRGPFAKDYFRSVGSLKGWGDGGRFFTNYVAHPLQGSFMGYIQVQNDPRGRAQAFGSSGRYWRSRMKALAWSAAWSTQFEIGPISQASIGNVGLKKKQTWVDIVVTPAAGLGVMLAEDAIDRYVIGRLEARWRNRWLKYLLRTLLNPSRASANLFDMKSPWYRDNALRQPKPGLSRQGN